MAFETVANRQDDDKNERDDDAEDN
jgi:hypothetical protein